MRPLAKYNREEHPAMRSAAIRVPVVIAAAALITSVPATVIAQSGTRFEGGPRVIQQAPFEQRLWDYLRASHYENWGPLPGKTADFYPGQSPHGDFLKLYVNRAAAANPQNIPPGSIVIKENYGTDRKTLMAITVMYRSQGFDPQHGDWYWVKYEPGGRVARMNGMPVAGKVTMCADCHSGTQGGDFVFAND
jgi:hypothetical protein